MDIQREDRTFQTLFSEVKAGKFDCIEVIDELKRATLLQVLVGRDRDKLMVTSAGQSVCGICEEFGKYVKFAVEVGDAPAPSLSYLSSRNAFSVMFAVQRQLQESENGVPFSIPVKTNKDKLYNDLVRLMIDLDNNNRPPSSFICH